MTKKQTSVNISDISKLFDKGFDRFDKVFTKKLSDRFDLFQDHFDSKINEAKEELGSEIKHLLGIDTSVVF